MLHYAAEARQESLSWHDIEALPFYVCGILSLFGVYELLSELPSATRLICVKAMLILVIVAMRAFILDDAAEDKAGAAA